MQIEKIAIAGVGRLTYSLARAIKNSSYSLTCIYSRNKDRDQARLNLPEIPVYSFGEHQDVFDTLILAVPDTYLRKTAEPFRNIKGLNCMLHCSGANDLHILSGIVACTGVLYPLQTFSFGREISFKTIPVLWEGDAEVRESLGKLAQELSDFADETPSAERAILHTGAVFANNFTNLMLSLASEFASSAGKNPGIYQSLVEETILKLRTYHPLEAQTGPARRSDLKTIQQHLEIIHKTHPHLEKVYQVLSDCIREKY